MAMTAVNALDTQLHDGKRLAEQRAHEPSMEEILTSIRRIIADDDVLPLTRPAAEVKPVEAKPVDIMLVEATTPAPKIEVPPAPPKVRLARIPPPVFAPLEPRAPVPAPEAVEIHVHMPAVPDPAPEVIATTEPKFVEPAPTLAEAAPEPDHAPRPILSPQTDASIATSLNALASTVFLQQTGMIEESIKEMLRPMLKTWLDDNLPVIVERLVRIEIERVARGGR